MLEEIRKHQVQELALDDQRHIGIITYTAGIQYLCGEGYGVFIHSAERVYKINK